MADLVACARLLQNLEYNLYKTRDAVEINQYHREHFIQVLTRVGTVHAQQYALGTMLNGHSLVLCAMLNTVPKEDENANYDDYLHQVAAVRHEYTDKLEDNFELLKTLCVKVLNSTPTFGGYATTATYKHIDAMYAKYKSQAPALKIQYDLDKVAAHNKLNFDPTHGLLPMVIISYAVTGLMTAAVAKMYNIGLDTKKYGDNTYVTKMLQLAYDTAYAEVQAIPDIATYAAKIVYSACLEGCVLNTCGMDPVEDLTAFLTQLL